MEARYVYRAVEDRLFLALGADEFPHTQITRELRFALREHLDFAKIYMTRCLGAASFAGVVPETRKSCMEEYERSMRDLVGSMPYVVQGEKVERKKEESIDDARLKAVERFNAITE